MPLLFVWAALQNAWKFFLIRWSVLGSVILFSFVRAEPGEVPVSANDAIYTCGVRPLIEPAQTNQKWLALWRAGRVQARVRLYAVYLDSFKPERRPFRI
jgi:hypothetical protein